MQLKCLPAPRGSMSALPLPFRRRPGRTCISFRGIVQVPHSESGIPDRSPASAVVVTPPVPAINMSRGPR